MLENLSERSLLDETVLNFIKLNHKEMDFQIASGSDEKELLYITQKLGLSNYFLSVNGSPKEKSKIVSEIISKHNYNINNCILIGDSINDYDSAKENGIIFLGYNFINYKNSSRDFKIISNFDEINLNFKKGENNAFE